MLGSIGALLGWLVLPSSSYALQVNLSTMTCAKYENEMLQASLPGYTTDPIDTVMWLFGYSVGRSGDRVEYGDSLRAYGFALDTECKNEPASSLMDAVITVKSKRDNPMDLTRLDCATFETRHQNLRKSDPESATTLTMWLFGYAVGLSGSHLMDTSLVEKFDDALAEHCSQHPKDSLFDALSAPNAAVPSPAPKVPPKAAAKH
jgi:HdeA/HdeB family